MRVCARCKQIVQDNETFCSRCGSTQFITQGNNQPRHQGQMQSPQGQRPQQMNQGQRPQQMQQRPQQMNQGQVQQGQIQQQMQQRPQQMNQGQVHQNMGQNMNQQYMNPNMQYQGQNMQYQDQNTQYTNSTTNVNSGYTMSDFMDEPVVEDTKGKKKKQPKQQNNQAGMQNIATDTSVITMKDWIITMVMLIIPIWNIVYMVKTIGDKTINESKRNYIKAYLIYTVAITIVSTILSVILMFAGVATFM